MKQKTLLLLILSVLLCGLFVSAQAETYTVPSGSLSTKVAYLKEVFPEGWYWNEWTSSSLGSYTQKTITINGYTTTISTKPCPEHTEVKTSCNKFNAGYQCCGWARMLFTLVWGETPYDNGYELRYIPDTDNAYCLDYLKPGDIVWSGNHYMFVLAVNGDTLTVSDCNSRYTCGIQWSRTITKTRIHEVMKKEGVGAIWSPTPFTVSSSNWESWRCIYSKGVNIRCQPFAGSTKIVGGVGYNEIFSLDADHITTTSAGTWGLCKTRDGETGWIKISDTSLCERVEIEVTDSTPRIAVSKKEATGNSDDDQCYIKAGPYEADTTIRVVPMDGVIYISGCVTNAYGNTWYITEDGYYVWSGDVTVKEPDTTIQSETDFRGAAVAVTNGCNLKDKPYAAAAHQANVAKGQSVQVVAQIINCHGNTWYRTESGKYVSAEEVEIFQADYSHYTDLNVSFVWKTDAYTRALPYSAMPKVNSVITGQVLQIKRAVINKYGNIWVQLDDGNFLCLYDKETYQNYGEFYEFSANPYVNANNLVLPAGTLPAGEDFTVSGTLEGVNNCPIAVVHLYVTESGTEHVVGDCDLRPTTPVSSVDLDADLNANDALDFASLAPGDYHATLRIIMGFKFNDYPWFFNKNYEILARTTFSIPATEEPACEHPDAEWVVIKLNSCTEDGEEQLICPDCNEVVDTYIVPANEHLASQWEVVMNATCTTDGERIRTCVWCNALLDTDTIPATDHPCDWRYTKEPTCTEKGEGEVYCTACGLILETETTPARGHTEGDLEVIKAPTCLEDGEEGTFCTVCGEQLSSSALPSYGAHTGQWVTTKEPTCGENGVSTRVCTVCGVTETKALNATENHYFDDGGVIKEPTCTEQGEFYLICAVCGYYFADASPAQGHTAGEWVVITEATATTDGLKRQSCTVCGTTLNEEVIPATGESLLSNITLSVGSGLKAVPGGTVTVPVSISNPDGVALGSITLYYTLPEGVSVSSVTTCGGAASASVTFNNAFIFASDIGTGITGSGQVLSITFAVDENAAFPLAFSLKPEIVSADLSADATPASITVSIEEGSKRVPGDVNEDGKVNSRDALAVIKYAAGQDVRINTANADVNADSRINSRDALAIIKYAAGQDVILK